MNKFFPKFLWIAILILAACSPRTPGATSTPEVPPTETPLPTMASPAITTTRPPDPGETVQAFFDALAEDDFAVMYAMLTETARNAISEEDFTRRYIDALAMAAVDTGRVTFEVLEMNLHPDEAQVSYRQTWQSALFGDLVRENRMALVLNDGQWQIEWSDGLVMPELSGGNVLRRLYYPPADRGDIYDRSGNPMVAFSDAYAIGLVPSRINLNRESELLVTLSQATGLSPEHLYTFYENAGYEYDFYIPVTDVVASRFNRYFNAVTGFDAVSVSAFSTRYFLDTGDGAHMLGYTSFVQPEEQDSFTRKGFWWTSRVARSGVELWADQYLSGRQGGALFLDDANGTQLEKLGETFVGLSNSVYLTVDRDLQAAAQDALFGLTGAVVVMEQDTGRILAMASSPTYSPNLFDPENTNSLFTSPFNSANGATINRAINGQYPLGSVFKIITMAAALESGSFTVNDTYDCQYTFEELLPLGPVLYDWTFDRNERNLAEDKDPFPPSGMLTLPQGLMRSCNPWFYHIGLTLYNEGLTTALSDMARSFGLGKPTGLIGVPGESEGQVRDPREPLEATNLAVGQGELLVTPMQVASFVNAVANGGTFYVPQAIETVVDPDGNILYQFTPQTSGELPVSTETLDALQSAMKLVTQNSRGTAEFVFRNFAVNLGGKTGTAQSGLQDPHAWFVAFTDENREDKPDVVIAVVVENVGDGSEWAAPVARRVLENYYFNRTIRAYPWEIRIGVPEWLAFEEPSDGSDE